MSLLQRACAALAAAAAILMLPAVAFASVDDAVMNKEGYWGIDVDNGACAASMTLQGGSIFLLRALHGNVTFALFGHAPLARGKVVRLETEGHGFDFKASYSEEGATLYYNGVMDARALAALRLARQVRILADGRQVAAMTFEGTGFEGALDGVIACSRGEKGWWGSGVGEARVAEGPMPDKQAAAPVLSKAGVWSISVGDPGICIAEAVAGEHRRLQVLAAVGRMGFAVSSDSDALPQGRKGRVETDAYAFDFPAGYGGRRYMSMSKPFDSQALSALASAKWIRVSVDDQVLLDASVEGSGLADLLDDVAACSKSQKGWWGEGAAAR